VPTIQDEAADGWWARRKRAFAPPYEVNFKQRHSRPQLRDLAACLREFESEFLALEK
jgi:hypothetical protein